MGFWTDKPLTAAASALPVTPVPFGSHRSLTASAKIVNIDKIAKKKAKTSREWQIGAWEGFNSIGEIHYGFSMLGDTFSRIRIYAAAVPLNSSDVPSPLESSNPRVPIKLIKDAKRLVDAITSHDFSSMTRNFAINMVVAGECLLLHLSDEGWTIRSTFEVEVGTDQIKLIPDSMAGGSSGDQQVIAKKMNGAWTPDLSIGRIWRQHPRYSDEPDSSLRALADPIEELLLLSRLIRTVSRARLNAGILFVPDGVTVLGGTTGEAGTELDSNGIPVNEDAVSADTQFIQELIEMMTAPITNEDSTSSVVPSVLTGSEALGAAIRHITFDRKVDEWLTSRVDRVLERIMQGIDVPKEVVQGLANVKYSNALVIDNNFWKSSIEPLALMFSDALTDIYLRKELLKLGYTEAQVNKVCIWYDPSEVVTSPDQSSDADTGYDKHLINGAAWRRTHGFGDEDAPDEKELAIQLLLSKGQLPEDVVSELLEVALPTIMKKSRAENVEGRVPESAETILNPSDNSNSEETPNG